MAEKHNFETFRLPLVSEMVQYYERSIPRTKNPRDYPRRRRFVNQCLSTLEEYIEPIVLSSQLINPEYIFRLPCSEGNSINLQDLEGPCHFKILSTDKIGRVVLFTKEEDIDFFKSRLRKYCSENGEKLDLYDKIGIPELIKNHERIGKSILKNPISDDLEEVDIYLWYFGPLNHQQIQNFINKLSSKIRFFNGEILNFEIILEFPLIQAKINKDILKELIKEPTIKIIERKIQLSCDHSYYNIDLNQDIRTTSPDSDIGILVLDESIVPGHPLISNSIQEYNITESINPDHLDHGTAVSSLVLYGDITEILSRTNPIFKPIGRLYFSSIYDEDISSPNKLKDIIEYFLDNYNNIKIINISVTSKMILDSIKLKQHPLGSIIDQIIYEYSKSNRELIFVVCTGNFFEYTEGRTEQNEYAYIRNFKNIILSITDNKIKDPATSSLALTIGSINLGLNLTNVNIIASYLSKRYYPSIFTRVGPGVNNSFKPDFVDFGSDVIKLIPSSIDEQNSGILVPITNQYGLLGYDNGSSFSTPIFSNKIAQFWKNYPDLTANSVKCLMLLGSEIKPEMKEFFTYEGLLKNLNQEQFQKILNVFGNGYVDLSNSLYSTNNYVVLLRERELAIKNFDLFDIPIPNEFYTSRGRRNLHIAISYTPPTKPSRQDYLGIKLDFHIFSNLSQEMIHLYYDLLQKNNYIEEEEFEMESYPDLQESDFDLNNFNQDDERQRKVFAAIISRDEDKVINVIESSSFSEKVKNSVLSKYVGRNKWTNKLFPPKKISKNNTLKKHCMEWTRSTPNAVPGENGLKILIFSKFSKTKWFEEELKKNSELNDYTFKYSIAISVKTEIDINLRNRIKQIIQQRVRIQ